MAAEHKIVVMVSEADHTIPLEIVELKDFSRDIDRLLPQEEVEEMRGELATLRQLGTVIAGTGGLRKFRWAAKQKGKRSGVRIIYFYGGDHMPIFLIAVYAKNEKTDMSGPEKKAAVKLVRTLEKEYKSKRPQKAFRVLQGRRT
ncbi:addiction module toxin RelE [Hyphomicrobium sp.]|uniref:addiction module toxin RelE n=1 Tax=Hyphomicrobium sp. TaxID=82 RepID=UPI001DEBAD70|nr:addiction module toxin RelE [Hyphomicrobium sp.]MBY0560359.1 type II toxin-antitoxin system RelE/ParE family toxin [Hyphomicrobium sp.]